MGISAFLLGASPELTLGESVTGHGNVLNGVLSRSQISFHAWRDDDGFVHGAVNWTGDITPGTFSQGGIADPWFLDVVDLKVEGNTAYVLAAVVHSLFPGDIGQEVNVIFIDNSASGDPGEIHIDVGGDGEIVAGNIKVTD